jgi:hypothetical protein
MSADGGCMDSFILEHDTLVLAPRVTLALTEFPEARILWIIILFICVCLDNYFIFMFVCANGKGVANRVEF